MVITHRNLLANIVPIEREIAKYRQWARPFLPIRFLNLLPLSHMFGQAMGTFVPPMLPGLVVFTRSYSPDDIIRQIHDRRVSVLVCVPKILEVLREHLVRVAPETAEAPPKMHWTARWWRYRAVHRMFGFKFWAIVVGAAPLDPELEAFWGRLGFVVIQGYGLTETAPIVTLNHPFHATKGAVGKPIAGVEIKIADDGEILVRGENVTRGYFNAPEETRSAFRDGWFHTGDVGELDASGQLRIRGRKKEMIVTPEGLNVFPEDVEQALNAQPGVRESAVVGASSPGSTAERVHAVLVLDPGPDLDDIVRRANLQLADHQKIRAAAVWPAGELPRTEGTRKLKRRELKSWLAGEHGRGTAPSGGDGALRRLGARALCSGTDPGRRDHARRARAELARTRRADDGARGSVSGHGRRSPLQRRQNRRRPRRADPPARGRRSGHGRRDRGHRVPGVEPIAPGARPAARQPPDVDPSARTHLRARRGPRARSPRAIGRTRHLRRQSPEPPRHAGDPRRAPARWRYRVAPAMAKEFFKAHFYPDQYGRKAYIQNSANYYLASLFFNAFPLPQRESGTRQTLRYIGELIGRGYSILIYPEGKRTQAGEIGRFQPGAAMIAARLDIPVVPVRLEGLDRVLHQSWKFPQRGPARVTFGPPISLKGNDYAEMAGRLEAAVKALDQPSERQSRS